MNIVSMFFLRLSNYLFSLLFTRREYCVFTTFTLYVVRIRNFLTWIKRLYWVYRRIRLKFRATSSSSNSQAKISVILLGGGQKCPSGSFLPPKESALVMYENNQNLCPIRLLGRYLFCICVALVATSLSFSRGTLEI